MKFLTRLGRVEALLETTVSRVTTLEYAILRLGGVKQKSIVFQLQSDDDDKQRDASDHGSNRSDAFLEGLDHDDHCRHAA